MKKMRTAIRSESRGVEVVVVEEAREIAALNAQVEKLQKEKDNMALVLNMQTKKFMQMENLEDGEITKESIETDLHKDEGRRVEDNDFDAQFPPLKGAVVKNTGDGTRAWANVVAQNRDRAFVWPTNPFGAVSGARVGPGLHEQYFSKVVRVLVGVTDRGVYRPSRLKLLACKELRRLEETVVHGSRKNSKEVCVCKKCS
ncbi:hypothetical protein LguiB_027082 [Lonicera macranthoides]